MIPSTASNTLKVHKYTWVVTRGVHRGVPKYTQSWPFEGQQPWTGLLKASRIGAYSITKAAVGSFCYTQVLWIYNHLCCTMIKELFPALRAVKRSQCRHSKTAAEGKQCLCYLPSLRFAWCCRVHLRMFFLPAIETNVCSILALIRLLPACRMFYDKTC